VGEVEEAWMLVLDRRVQEGFWIEGRIFVKVLSIGRKRVKLGIEAPEGMKVVREELMNGVRPSSEGEAEAAERSVRGERR
jgi:carbon storage regulator CsrA